MNDKQEHQGLVEEGIWKLCLDEDFIDEALQSFEQHTVTTEVDLILKCSDPSNFCLTQIQALRLIRLITSHRDSIVWHELFLEVASESPVWYDCVSHIAGYFPKISVAMTLSSQLVPLETFSAINNALQQDSRLQELSLSQLILTDDSMEMLSQVIRSPSAPSLRRLSLSNVDCIPSQQENTMSSRNNHPLAVALTENTTLKRIELRNCMNSNQETLFYMMNALVGSTNLEELCLENITLATPIRIEQDDTNLIVPLTRILTDPQCQIRIFDLNMSDIGRLDDGQERHNLQTLLSSLEQNSSIESMDLSENELDPSDMTKVLDCLKIMPSIRQVDLNDQSDLVADGSIRWLANSCLLEASPTTRLTELQIDNYLPDIGAFDYDSDSNDDESNGQMAEMESILLKLLQNNPSLGNIGLDVDDVSDRLPPSVVYLLDLNLCGRRLLVPTLASRTKSRVNDDCIPLGLWPIVLQRANTLVLEFPQRRATILYHLLQNGQFLLKR